MARTPRTGTAAGSLADAAREAAETGDAGGALAAATGASGGGGGRLTGGGNGGKNGGNSGGNKDGGEGPSLVSMAQAFAGLPMEALIGGPLNAAAEANQQMGLAQINFLMTTCFSKSTEKGADSYTPVMVKTSVVRNVIDLSTTPPKTVPVTATIELPLFTLLPINTLGVTSVQVDFTMNVTSSYSNEATTSNTVTGKANATYQDTIDLWFSKTTITGSVSVDTQYLNADKATYQKQNSATYKVSVSAAQLPLPPGVTTLIQAFTNNITPLEVHSGKP